MASTQLWIENNQIYLVDRVDEIRNLLESYADRSPNSNKNERRNEHLDKTVLSSQVQSHIPTAKVKCNDMMEMPALEIIANLFSLSKFEKSILTLCAGIELDSEISTLCSRIHGDPNRAYPTFGLALAILPEPHWNALAPTSPLRYNKLIELFGFPQAPLTSSPLRIEERVLHYLTGISYLDKQLESTVKPILNTAYVGESHKKLAEQIMVLLRDQRTSHPCINLWGRDEVGKMGLAKWICTNHLRMNIFHLRSQLIPSRTDELISLIGIWTREAALLNAALYISTDLLDRSRQDFVQELIESISSPIFLSTFSPWTSSERRTISVEVKKPSELEQREIWRNYLGEYYSNYENEVSNVVSQFDMNASSIYNAVSKCALAEPASSSNTSSSSSLLWESARIVTRPNVGDLMQRIVPRRMTLDDIVLPYKEKQQLRDIIASVKQRHKVCNEWGFEEKSTRGLSITALFFGESGTGKTMAAEVLAGHLNLDLFRIDLSMVVNKYIGETEKNLRQIFDSAEYGGAILFFDESDVLFGKRSEVKDSHDRYANIEIGYLLQRMESYRGLAILTTNMRNSLDSAFIRRIRFIVQFPFPDEKTRLEIWQNIFPQSTPVEGLNYAQLSKLNITGGHIHNIALYASFVAAEEGVAVNMAHLKRAAKSEYDKMERPLLSTELGESDVN